MTSNSAKYLVLLVVLLVSANVKLQGQDIHFSQFNKAPLYINPAFTGISNYEHRVGINYRNQWGSVLGPDAFNTMSAFYDRRVPNTDEDQFGFGATAFGDVAGSAKLGFYYGAVSGSYARQVAGDRYRSYKVVVGANLGVGQYSVKRGNLRWPSQFDENGQFDPDSPSPDINGTSNPFMDIGAGALFYGLLDQDMYLYRKTNFYVGGSVFHVNRPKVSFTSSGSDQTKANLNMKYIFHAGLEYGMSNQLSLIPAFVFIGQGESTEINGGITTRLLLNNKLASYEALDLGISTRFVNNYSLDESGNQKKAIGLDALIFSANIDYGKFSIGLSYDYNVSDLRAISNGQEGIEISFQYLIDGNLRTNVYSPRF